MNGAASSLWNVHKQSCTVKWLARRQYCEYHWYNRSVRLHKVDSHICAYVPISLNFQSSCILHCSTQSYAWWAFMMKYDQVAVNEGTTKCWLQLIHIGDLPCLWLWAKHESHDRSVAGLSSRAVLIRRYIQDLCWRQSKVRLLCHSANLRPSKR